MKYTVKKRLLRILIDTYHLFGIDKLLIRIGVFDRKIQNTISNMSRNSNQSTAELAKDIKQCFYRYLVSPEEYFLFDFEGKNEDYRDSFLSDRQRNRLLYRNCSEKQFIEELSDKFYFYKLTQKYFGRKALLIDNKTNFDFNKFENFLENNKKVFVKPLSDCCGKGAHILDLNKIGNVENLFFNTINRGDWMVEELIIQSKEMALWNSSSVNTIRLPCFYVEGKFYILNPFLRTGRKGSIVDNGGAGGIIAAVDENTGVIVSDGIDEQNHNYSNHPDSGVKFKDWQVPRWKELKEIAQKVFTECFKSHKYIGFDFALTDNGWILIEGNWGQFLGQFASKKGIKYKFMEYMNIKEK